jgi:hypothetical protein
LDMSRSNRSASEPIAPTTWSVAYLLNGKPLAEVTVSAVSKEEAEATARPQVRANIRHIADKTRITPAPDAADRAAPRPRRKKARSRSRH